MIPSSTMILILKSEISNISESFDEYDHHINGYIHHQCNHRYIIDAQIHHVMTIRSYFLNKMYSIINSDVIFTFKVNKG